MSLFTLFLRLSCSDTKVSAEGSLRFIEESPDVMRSYRHDETHYRDWLEMQEKKKNSVDQPEPSSINF